MKPVVLAWVPLSMSYIWLTWLSRSSLRKNSHAPLPTCIEWDASETDIDEYKLPQRCRVKIFADTPEDEIEGELSEALTEDYGFCNNGFAYSKLEKKHKKLKEGTVFYYDTEKNGYRSFNESQLVEFIQR